MQNIKDILNYPNGTPIEAVQAKLAKVYEYKPMPNGTYGPTTVQNIVLEDATGASIKVSVWGHPDMAKQEGGEFVFSGGKTGKGLVVKKESYTNKEGKPVNSTVLSMSKAGTMQHIEVHHAQAGTVPSPATGCTTPGPTPTPIPQQNPTTGIVGAKAGMLLNNAVLLLAHSGALEGVPVSEIVPSLRKVLGQLIQVSDELEQGKILPPTSENKAANLVDKKTGAAAGDEEVPY